MIKKIIICGVLAITVFSLVACGFTVEEFNSLSEMQIVMPNDIYYFDFDQEGIKEIGRYQTTNKKNNDGSYDYIRYSVQYDVEFIIEGQKQKRDLKVVGTRDTHTITFIGKDATSLDPLPDLSEIEAICRIGYSEKDGRLLLTFSFESTEEKAKVGYYYYFVLDGVQKIQITDEIESFITICKHAIANKYQYK